MSRHKAIACDTTHPCVVTTVPSTRVTAVYSHVTTEGIVNALATRGWSFARGTARATRIPERASHVAHVLRFNNHKLPRFADGNVLEVVVLNSSDGSTALEVGLGIYRIACANGLVVRGGAVNGIRLPHRNISEADVLDAVEDLVAKAPDAVKQVNWWRSFHPNIDQQRALAHQFALERWGDRLVDIDLGGWLVPQRSEDRDTDFWTVFNRLQERIVRGGGRVLLAPDEARGGVAKWTKARPLRGAVLTCRLNGRLWDIAADFARDVSGFDGFNTIGDAWSEGRQDFSDVDQNDAP